MPRALPWKRCTICESCAAKPPIWFLFTKKPRPRLSPVTSSCVPGISMPPVDPRSRSPSFAVLESKGVKKLPTLKPAALGFSRTTLLPKFFTPSKVPLPLT